MHVKRAVVAPVIVKFVLRHPSSNSVFLRQI